MGLSREEMIQKAAESAKNKQVDQIESLADAWRKLDVNGDETILVSEVDTFLTDLGINMPQEAKDELINTLDKNGNGTISFIEFVIAYNDGLFDQYME